MSVSGRPPGLRLAIGAFVLTVLLGIGGASASALWQQSANATMTVTATGTWPGPPFTLACSTANGTGNGNNGNGNNGNGSGKPANTATIRVTAPQALATLTYAVELSAGTYGTNYSVPNVAGTAVGNIVLDDKSAVFTEKPTPGPWKIRIIAVYSDQTTTSASLALTFRSSDGALVCP